MLLELVHGDALVAALVLDDELALVDLFLVDLVRVDAELLGDHLPCRDRGYGTPAVHPDHDDVVKVDLLALGKLVEAHGIAALDGNPSLLVIRAVEVFLHELGHEQGAAVERPAVWSRSLGSVMMVGTAS